MTLIYDILEPKHYENGHYTMTKNRQNNGPEEIGLVPPLNMAIICKCYNSGLILGVCPANEKRRYCVTTSLVGWAKPGNQPCFTNPIYVHTRIHLCCRMLIKINKIHIFTHSSQSMWIPLKYRFSSIVILNSNCSCDRLAVDSTFGEFVWSTIPILACHFIQERRLECRQSKALI